MRHWIPRTPRNVPTFLIVSVAMLLFLGCGEAYYSDYYSLQLTPSAAAQEVVSVLNFGDSITCGYDAQPNNGTGNVYSTQGYAGLMDTWLAKPVRNFCRAGDQAADMTKLWVYPNAAPVSGRGQLFTVLIGTNNAIYCGGSSACLANWSGALSASLTWLALPASDKVLGSSLGNAGSAWSTDSTLANALDTRVHGATLSFKVQQAVAGRTLYVGYRVFDSNVQNAGTATLSVDGQQVAILNATVNTGHALATQNGTTDTVFVQGVPLGAVGTHVVSLTTTSSDGALFSFVWAGVSSGIYTAANGGPRVVIGSIPQSPSAPLNGIIQVYNAYLSTLITGLTADGMNIQIAPVYGVLDPSTDFVDTVHPNNVGHAKLAQVFATTI